MELAGTGASGMAEGKNPVVTGEEGRRITGGPRELSEECATKGLNGNMEGTGSDVCRSQDETTAWSTGCEQGLVGGVCDSGQYV